MHACGIVRCKGPGRQNSRGHHRSCRQGNNCEVSMNPKLQSFALTGLRLALATAFLSAVAGRLGLWGKYGSGWIKFVDYVGSVNWYLPTGMIAPVAIIATILETAFG